MIYFSDNGNLTSNIVLSKVDYIEELKDIRKRLDEAFGCSKSFVDTAFSDEEIQKKEIISLNDFLVDDYMLPVLYGVFSKLDFNYASYILKKISSDYEYFVFNIYDRISFKEINCYNINDLKISHKVNKDFGINDNYEELLSYVNEAEKNSMVLKLTKNIRGKKLI